MLNPIFDMFSDVIETLRSPVNLSVGACFRVESQLLPTMQYCTSGTTEIAKDAHVVLFGAIAAGSLLLNAYGAYKALRGKAAPVAIQAPAPVVPVQEVAVKEQVVPVQEEQVSALVQEPIAPVQAHEAPQDLPVLDEVADPQTPEVSEEKVEDLQEADEVDQEQNEIEKPKVPKL